MCDWTLSSIINDMCIHLPVSLVSVHFLFIGIDVLTRHVLWLKGVCTVKYVMLIKKKTNNKTLKL